MAPRYFFTMTLPVPTVTLNKMRNEVLEETSPSAGIIALKETLIETQRDMDKVK